MPTKKPQKKDKVPPVAPAPTYGQAGMDAGPPKKAEKPKKEPGPIKRAIKALKDAKKGKI